MWLRLRGESFKTFNRKREGESEDERSENFSRTWFFMKPARASHPCLGYQHQSEATHSATAATGTSKQLTYTRAGRRPVVPACVPKRLAFLKKKKKEKISPMLALRGFFLLFSSTQEEGKKKIISWQIPPYWIFVTAPASHGAPLHSPEAGSGWWKCDHLRADSVVYVCVSVCVSVCVCGRLDKCLWLWPRKRTFSGACPVL